MAPECGVRWVFAIESVVTNELEGELVVTDEHLGRKRQSGFEESIVLVARELAVCLPAEPASVGSVEQRCFVLTAGWRRVSRSGSPSDG